MSETIRRRLLVTGSRDWENDTAIAGAILQQWVRWGKPPVTLVHGGAGGADTMAANFVRSRIIDNPMDKYENGQWMFSIEQHDADWETYGRSAGHKRNALMVDLGADACLAFMRNSSRGTMSCIRLAVASGIPTRVFRDDDGIEVIGQERPF